MRSVFCIEIIGMVGEKPKWANGDCAMQLQRLRIAEMQQCNSAREQQVQMSEKEKQALADEVSHTGLTHQAWQHI